jgi:hypothetical protein
MSGVQRVFAALCGFLFVLIAVTTVAGEALYQLEQPDWTCRMNPVYGLFFSPACENETLSMVLTVVLGVPRLMLMPVVTLIVAPGGALGNAGFVLYAIPTVVVIAQGFAFWHRRKPWVGWASLAAIVGLIVWIIAAALANS